MLKEGNKYLTEYIVYNFPQTSKNIIKNKLISIAYLCVNIYIYIYVLYVKLDFISLVFLNY